MISPASSRERLDSAYSGQDEDPAGQGTLLRIAPGPGCIDASLPKPAHGYLYLLRFLAQMTCYDHSGQSCVPDARRLGQGLQLG